MRSVSGSRTTREERRTAHRRLGGSDGQSFAAALPRRPDRCRQGCAGASVTKPKTLQSKNGDRGAMRSVPVCCCVTRLRRACPCLGSIPAMPFRRQPAGSDCAHVGMRRQTAKEAGKAGKTHRAVARRCSSRDRSSCLCGPSLVRIGWRRERGDGAGCQRGIRERGTSESARFQARRIERHRPGVERISGSALRL